MQTERDALTGLLTAAAFHEELDRRAREGANLVLAAMDLDKFLQINERYGHQGGDAWLRACAERFAKAFGPDALAARYGGDEFLALVPAGDLYEVYRQAEALRLEFAEGGPEITVDGQAARPGHTVTLGLAAFPANAGDAGDLIEKAETALRRAKIAGGNQVAFYQETDTLTGLLNYYASQRALQAAFEQARQARAPLSVFLLDIDEFAAINEEHGHRAGDEVLRRLARILKSNFKDIGAVGRIGGHEAAIAGAIGRIAGDEFIVILPGQHADSAFILAEEVRRLVADSPIALRLGGRDYELRFTISGGIATFPGDASEQVDLLRKADEALYRAKRSGRNRISLPAAAQMVTKTSYYTQIQLERLSDLARRLGKTEASLLREALDDLLRRYEDDGG